MKLIQKIGLGAAMLASVVGCEKASYVRVSASQGSEGYEGKIVFTTQDATYWDEGFDGTLDKVILHTSDGPVELTDSTAIRSYQEGYMQARNAATYSK